MSTLTVADMGRGGFRRWGVGSGMAHIGGKVVEWYLLKKGGCVVLTYDRENLNSAVSHMPLHEIGFYDLRFFLL